MATSGWVSPHSDLKHSVPLKLYVPRENENPSSSLPDRHASLPAPPSFPFDTIPAIPAAATLKSPLRYRSPFPLSSIALSQWDLRTSQQLDSLEDEDYDKEEAEEEVDAEKQRVEEDIDQAEDEEQAAVEAETLGKKYMHAKDWSGSNDEGNPWNWSTGKKALHTAVPSLCAFVATFASSVYAVGVEDVQRDLGVTTEMSLLPYSLYVLGLAFGPMLAAPCSETFGRKPVYLLSIPIFMLFTLGAGFSQNIASLIICRFLAGVFASPSLSIGSATISDVWIPVKRSTPMALYVSTPFLGPCLGPLVGGFVVEKKGWRWTQWTLIFFTIVCYFPALFMNETYKTVILRQRAKKESIEGPPRPERTTKQAFTFFLKSGLTRPLHMLFVEPVVAAFSFYVGFVFAVQYLFYAAFPYVFATVYGFNLGAQGLSYLGLGIGCVMGTLTIVFINKSIYLPKFRKAHGKLPPEHRLYPLFVGGPCIPVSLFWFGWTAREDILWISPVIAEFFFGYGNYLIFQGATMYVMEFYGPLHGASAMGANAFVRYGLSVVFPLFALQMYGFLGDKGLGIGGATSLLGGISVLLATLPWIFWYTGPKLRSTTHFKHGA